MKNSNIVTLRIVVLAVMLGLVACGGGSKGGAAPSGEKPAITMQPSSQSVAAGNGATFSVTATGAAPLRYQWNRNGASLSGATSATYRTAVTTNADNGSTFTVTVSNSAGSVTSAAAILTVTPSVPVSGILVSPVSATVDMGGMSSLTATVSPNNATNKSVTWKSSDTTVATVNAAGLVTGVKQGSVKITATAQDGSGVKSNAADVSVTGVAARHMQIGVNLWNIGWDGWQNYYKSGVDWNTETNPWNPKLLADLARVNGPIRFMDMDAANYSVIVEWKDRIQKTEDHYQAATVGHDVPVAAWVEPYAGGRKGTAQIWGMAYEWMIDLCNRTGHDLWINVPPFANADYWTQLAKLINTNLDPKLKVYVEYSNETWNWISLARDYSMAMGAQMQIPDAPHDVVSENQSQWYVGPAWSVWQSLNIFNAFVDVFGAENTGLDKRLVRVIAFSENADRTARVPIGNIVFNGAPDGNETPDLTLNPIWNPHKMVPDMLAFAPYIGPAYNLDPTYPDIDGAAVDAQAKFHADIVDGMAHAWSDYRAIGTLYGIPMGTYEGGNQLSRNADVFNRSPAIYDEYTFFFDQIDTMGLVTFNHYTLYGAYDSGSAWGLKQTADTADTKEAAPKWQAVKDWLAAHP